MSIYTHITVAWFILIFFIIYFFDEPQRLKKLLLFRLPVNPLIPLFFYGLIAIALVHIIAIIHYYNKH